MGKTAPVFTVLLVLSFVLVVVSGIEFVKAEPNTFVVPDDYSTIQEAINNTVDGDTIYVKSGTYHERLVIGKQISLIGEDTNSTVIGGSDYYLVVEITCDWVKFSGFTICSDNKAIQLNGASYCNISGNRMVDTQMTGIMLFHSSFNIVSGNIIEDVDSLAISLDYSNNNTIHGNQIVTTSGGIRLKDSDCNNVSENCITDADRSAIGFAGASGNQIVENNLTHCGYGVSFYYSDTNIFCRNNFVDNAEQFLDNGAPTTDGGIMFSVSTWSNNYWSDYTGADSDGDGIGETPYIINDYNQDDSPVMNPHIIPEFSSWTILPLLFATILMTLLIKKRLIRTP